jgi:glycosyltransferase involved in cell wall biosynthesis
MANLSPLVSIVIPAYNAERFLREALSSICAQTHADLEIIVCDDASTDRTGEIARDTGDDRVRYLRNDRTLGGYGAMNRGVRESRGDYVAIYHADDVYDDRIVERELAFLRARSDVGAVFCLDRFIDESGREYNRLRLPKALDRVDLFDTKLLADSLLRYKNTFLRTPSVMFRRAAFESVGGFDQTGFGIAADLDMWVRLSLEWRIGLVHEYLMAYRHYAAQWSKQYERMRTEPELFFSIMDLHLSRLGIRSLVTDEALTAYRVWRSKDDTECAVNAYMIGDRQRALALLRDASAVPLIRSSHVSAVARVLALRTVLRLAAASGSSVTARRLVHFSRFRRLPPRDLAPPSTLAAQSLASNAGAIVTSAPNVTAVGPRSASGDSAR